MQTQQNETPWRGNPAYTPAQQELLDQLYDMWIANDRKPVHISGSFPLDFKVYMRTPTENLFDTYHAFELDKEADDGGEDAD